MNLATPAYNERKIWKAEEYTPNNPVIISGPKDIYTPSD